MGHPEATWLVESWEVLSAVFAAFSSSHSKQAELGDNLHIIITN